MVRRVLGRVSSIGIALTKSASVPAKSESSSRRASTPGTVAARSGSPSTACTLSIARAAAVAGPLSAASTSSLVGAPSLANGLGASARIATSREW